MIDRQILAKALIAGGVLYAGHAFFIAPLGHERQSVLAELEQLRESLAELELMERSAASQEIVAAHAAAAALERQGRFATDPAALFAKIDEAARQTGVRVDQFDPGEQSGGREARQQRERGVVGAGYSLVTVGTYEGLVRFLEQLQTEFGFCRVRSVTLAPAFDGEGTVFAQIETVHYSPLVDRFLASVEDGE